MSSPATPVGSLRPRLVEVEGRWVHLWEVGEGAPTLLLHGFSDDGSCWVSTVDLFTEGGRRVIAPDARAHGRTPLLSQDAFTADARLNDVISLEEALAIEGALVVGHSMGAITAMQLAEKRPDLVQAAILVDPPLVGGEHDRRADTRNRHEEWLSGIDSMDPLELTDICRRENPNWTDDEISAWVSSKQLMDRELFRRRQAWHGRPWREVVGAIQRPTLVVAGEVDLGSLIDATAGSWLDATAGIEFVRIPGAGHSVHRDQRERFSAAVREFLARLV